MTQFLIDECLTRRLVSVAHIRGYEAEHVKDVGLASTPDPVVARAAYRRGDVFVTNNARDFRRLYAKFTAHPGLVIIIPSVRWPRQVELFDAVISFIASNGAVVDLLVEIDAEGVIATRPWPQLVTPQEETD